MRIAQHILLTLALAAAGCGTPGEAIGEVTEAIGLDGGASQRVEVPLVVVLWENSNYGGRKRQFVANSPHLGAGYVVNAINCDYNPVNNSGCHEGPPLYAVPGADFNDVASAVGVHPGPDYDEYIARTGREPTVTLFTDDDYAGVPVRLAAGAYADLSAFGINDAVSSLQLDDSTTQGFVIHRSADPAAAISSIPYVVQLHSASLDRRRNLQEGDNVLTLVESSTDLREYGFNDAISSVEILPGPSYPGFSVSLYPDAGYGGTPLTTSATGDWAVSALGYNDCVSSVKIQPRLPFTTVVQQ